MVHTFYVNLIFCINFILDRNIAKLTKVKIIKRPGQQWEDLPIPVR